MQADQTCDDFSLKSIRNNKQSTKLKQGLTPTYFTVQFDSVEFRLKTESGTTVEPYFLSLSLFDVKNGKKISEDFHSTIDINGKIIGNEKVFVW